MGEALPARRPAMASSISANRQKPGPSGSGATRGGYGRAVEETESCLKCLAYGNYCSAGCREWAEFGENL